ncbi:hypothetical protein [Spiroplasma chinense]|nr:hypothetical protein [Spiroplasma chinense]
MKKETIENIKLGFKYFFAITPLIGIVVFAIGQSIDLFSNPDTFWVKSVLDRKDLFEDNFFEKLTSWNVGEKLLFLFCRNFLTFTTMINVASSCFWIYSIKNHSKEGSGRFDNYRYGIMIMGGILWIAFFYNLSLSVTGAIKVMKWYTYVSWLTEHSIPQFSMVIYFLVFYKKVNVTRDKKQIAILWAETVAVVSGYLVFFTITGAISQATNSFPFFADMSSTGHYVYDFLDMTKANTRVNLGFLNPLSQWFLAIILFSTTQTLYFIGTYFLARKQSVQNV